MAYASQQWTKELVGKTIKESRDKGLLGTGSYFFGMDKFTEEEQIIGEYMGKPLYRKVYKGVGALGTKTLASIADLNLDRITNLYGSITIKNNLNVTPISFYASNTNYEIIYINSTNKTIEKSGSYDCDYIAILEYTKTTDPANSFTPSMVTNNIVVDSVSYDDYSEEEIVVGRYIDGKPIYRRVVKVNNPVIVNNTPFLNIEIDSLVNIGGFGLLNFNGTYFKVPILFSSNNQTTNFVCVYYDIAQKGFWYVIGSDIASSGSVLYVILEYTKTTDAENSFTPSMIRGGITIEEASVADVEEVWA